MLNEQALPIFSSFGKSFKLNFQRFFAFLLSLQVLYYFLVMLQLQFFVAPVEAWMKEVLFLIENRQLEALQTLAIPEKEIYLFASLNALMGFLSLNYLLFLLFDRVNENETPLSVGEILLRLFRKIPAWVGFNLMHTMVCLISPYFLGFPSFLFNLFFALTFVYLFKGAGLIEAMKKSFAKVNKYRFSFVFTLLIFYLCENALLYSLDFPLFNSLWMVVYFVMMIFHFAKLKYFVFVAEFEEAGV